MKRFLSVLLIMMVVIGSYAPAFAADMVSAAIIIHVPGGGTVAIEGDDLGEILKVPQETGEVTFEFEPHGIGRYYYKVSQIAGSDPNIIYDETEYTVGLYVTNENDRLVSTVVVQKNDEEEKPEEICFYNITEETMTITRTIHFEEIVTDGRDVTKEVVQTALLKRSGNYVKNQEEEQAEGEKQAQGGNIITLASTKSQPILTLKGAEPRKETYQMTYSKWEFVEGDTSPVKVPDHPKKEIEGWVPDKEEIEEWIIDLDKPHNEVIYVIYTPRNKADDKNTPANPDSNKKDGRRPKTGDESNAAFYVELMGIALSLAIGLYLLARRKE